MSGHTSNNNLQRWVEEWAAILQPDDVHLRHAQLAAHLGAGAVEDYRRGCIEMFERFAGCAQVIGNIVSGEIDLVSGHLPLIWSASHSI